MSVAEEHRTHLVCLMEAAGREELAPLSALAGTGHCRVTVAGAPPDVDGAAGLEPWPGGSPPSFGEEGQRGSIAALLRGARRRPGDTWSALREALETDRMGHLLTGALLADGLAGTEPDVIYARGGGNDALAAGQAASLMSVPLLLRLQACDVESPESLSRLRLLASSARRILVPSLATASRMEETGIADPSRIQLARPGVRISDLESRRTRSATGPVAVCVAPGLAPRSGVRVLLEAVRLLQAGVPGLSVRVIGKDQSGRRLGRYRQAVETGCLAGVVEMVGAPDHSEAMEMLSKADMLLLPSVRAADGDVDDVPVPLAEAFAMGVPVVASRISGIPELVSHGCTGLLARPNDPADLAATVRWALEHSQEMARMGAAAAGLAAEELDASRVAEGLVRIVEDVSGRL